MLEHCTDEQKQKGIMEEILRSTCALAQDQYGNYVVQVSVCEVWCIVLVGVAFEVVSGEGFAGDLVVEKVFWVVVCVDVGPGRRSVEIWRAWL